MKIGYFADGPWSHRALEQLLAVDEFSIGFIVPRFDTQDPILKAQAEIIKCDFLPCENVNDENFVDRLAAYGADLFVSMSFNQILKKRIIELPRQGFLNCHAGDLPFYRGRNPLNWALINGEDHFGITVHFVDEGIDTGDILLQKKVTIWPDDNYGDLLTKAHAECAGVLVDAVKLVSTGQYDRVKQTDIDPIGTYFGQRKLGDEWLSFDWPASRLNNFIRGIARPAPCARFSHKNVEYGVCDANLVKGAHSVIGTNGEVIGRSGAGVYVKCGDSQIFLKNIFEASNPSEIFSARFPIGSRLVGRNE